MRKWLHYAFAALLASAYVESAQAAGFCHPVADTPQALDAGEVDSLVRRAVLAAQVVAPTRKATIAVVDRVGNVLGVFRSTGSSGFPVTISSGSGVSGGLDGVTLGLGPTVAIDSPDGVVAIAKAVTGAYLSSSGNAFSTRTASFIVQKNFIPTLRNFPSGPLFGVQFSQLPCGDFVVGSDSVSPGPHRSPLGLSADPGGFPLYKLGRVVGGIGVVLEGRDYTLDPNPINVDSDPEEIVAQSATLAGGTFAAPACIRADKITAGGFNLRYSDADNKLVRKFLPGSDTADLDTLGSYIRVRGYIDVPSSRAGVGYGDFASGYALAADLGVDVSAQFGTPVLNGRRLSGMVLVDEDGIERFPPIGGTAAEPGAPPLTALEVRSILQQALGVANQARAQIRRPLNSPAEVTISVVDTAGVILGLVRTPDAPVFGTDVSVQKARTAAFLSARDALSTIESGLGLSDYAGRARDFFGLAGDASGIGKAFTPRAFGNVHRPNFPDGIAGKGPGPFSTPDGEWSPFNVGLQLDAVIGGIVGSLLTPEPPPGTSISGNAGSSSSSLDITAAGGGCAADDRIANGLQIFPGAVPIYRGRTLVGAIGISGDGVDQDDMIAALGLERARAQLARNRPLDAPGGTYVAPGHAPRSMRSDSLSVPGPGSLRYVQCPQSPFISSQAQNVCIF